MPRLRVIPRTAWLALLVVLLVGGGIRAYQATHPVDRLSTDARSYTVIAEHLVRTGHYAGTSGRLKALHWPPATAETFGIAYAISPGDRPIDRQDLNPLYWTQFVISTATILAAFALGWLLLGPWTGVLAGAIIALYPPLFWGPSNLLSEPLGALMVTSAFVALTAGWRSRRPVWFALAGSLFGGVLLTRTDLLFVPALIAVLVLVVLGLRVNWRRGLLSAVLLLAACAVVVLPWTIHASRVAGKLTPLTTGGGSAFFVGTYLPGNGSTFDMKFAMLDQTRRLHPGTYDHTNYKKIPAAVVLNDVAARNPGLDRDASLLKEAKANLRRYALRQPVSFARMMLFKAQKMWLRATLGGSSTKKPLVRIGHVVLVLLAGFGLVWAVVRRRDPALGAILIALATATGVHMLAVAHGRYNLPLMPILVAGGSAGWLSLLDGFRRRRRTDRPRPVPAARGTASTGPGSAGMTVTG